MFDKDELSFLTVMIGLGVRFGSILFIFLAILTYKPNKNSTCSKDNLISQGEDNYGSVPSEKYNPDRVQSAEVGVQANFPSGKTRKKGSIETTDL